MAIGLGRILGFHFLENFRYPYISRSLTEFWRRWHISLSTWFRDYVYIPLGGNRVPAARWAANILIVFAVSGLWHGANWTYLIWGMSHGGALILEVMAVWLWRRWFPVPRMPPVVARFLGWVWAFGGVTLGWIFFRSASLDQALEVVHRLTSIGGGVAMTLPPPFSRFELAVAALALVWMLIIEVPQQGQVDRTLRVRPRWLARLAVWGTLLLVLNFGIFSHPEQFVYFQF